MALTSLHHQYATQRLSDIAQLQQASDGFSASLVTEAQLLRHVLMTMTFDTSATRRITSRPVVTPKRTKAVEDCFSFAVLTDRETGLAMLTSTKYERESFIAALELAIDTERSFWVTMASGEAARSFASRLHHAFEPIATPHPTLMRRFYHGDAVELALAIVSFGVGIIGEISLDIMFTNYIDHGLRASVDLDRGKDWNERHDAVIRDYLIITGQANSPNVCLPQ